ncbi:amino acid adenylation domain-containing protein [Pseudomonas sp. 681]|uniref:Amino acid adenylation domain-containing protein n=1 Tax=Pseudomonas fungipugnans TaxID=3024217 RepID=A0ABT6QL87_9PSED|nr:non-ribosomal peptide synthetase [Pseudomonas sp. 681]MDI2591032.1 amino acid adenylation domain-containing protein [Pseudomonas sp. 681]
MTHFSADAAGAVVADDHLADTHAQTFPLTAAQRDIWLDQLRAGDSPLYNIGGYVELSGRIDAGLIQRAVECLVEKHDALRTRLVPGAGADGLPLQRFARRIPVQVPLYDFADRPDPQAAAQALMQQQMALPYTLEHGPLFRFFLVRLSNRHHLLGTQAHHLILDGWGFGQMLQSLGGIYSALERGVQVEMSAPSYVDFIRDDARYHGSDRHTRDQAYWLDKYRTLPEPLLVPRHRNQQVQSSNTLVLPFPTALHECMKRLARTCQASAFHVLLAAMQVYFSRTAQRDECVFGLPILNRSNARFKSTLGLFTQVSAVRFDFAGELSFGELIRAIRDVLKQDFRHQRLPLSEMNRALGLLREDRSQLFDLSVSYEQDDHDYRYGEAMAHAVKVSNRHEPTPLAVHLRSNAYNDKAWVHYVYNEAYFERAEVEALAGRLIHVLEQGLSNLTLPIGQFSLMPADEAVQTQQWNDTDVEYPPNLTLHQCIEVQTAEYPDAVALIAGEQQLTRRELNERANQLAHHLREQGVGPDSRVAICVERGLDMVVGLLAILKAGGAYVPLDPAYPLDRLAYMLADSAPAVALVQGSTRGLLGEVAVPVIDLDQPVWRDQPLGNPHIPELTPQHLAYVIYTSGSTGQPKGVMNEHGAVINRLLWMQDAYNLTPGDAVLQKTPFSFDVSVWEFFWPLMTGARLVMARPEGHKDPAYLSEVIKAEHITTLHFVPSMLDVFLAHADMNQCMSVTRVMCSGEALPGSVVRRFKVQMPGSELHNLYGPTEAAVDVTAWSCAGPVEQTPDNTPIGKPIANTRMYLLDGQMRPVPTGVVGELYIGGVQVARGYLHRPELTAERFLQDPFSDDPTARMYRTGDVARYRTDGNIEYLGRNDDQVKIRGLRIELGEIQARLTQYPGINEAVVVAREDVPGDKRLIAYYTGDAQGIEALREHLRHHLPEYMVPAVLMHLDALPLSPNGKLDRKALPVPDQASLPNREYAAPQGEVEETLAQIWAEVLKVERVGRHDNFFELGGHSLLAVSLIARMRVAGMVADVRGLFARPTLSAQAAAVGGDADEFEVPVNRIAPNCAQITPTMLPLATLTQQDIDTLVASVPGGVANVQDIYGLTPLQAGILYHHLAADVGDPYLTQAQFAFASLDHLHAFTQALQSVIERHDVFRSSFHWEGLSEPVQVVWRQASLVPETVELDNNDVDALSQLQGRFDSCRYRLDITRAPLLRLVHARDAVNHRVVALLLFHHLIMDHLALEVMQQDMQACLLGHGERLDEPVPYRNYVAQTRLDAREQEHEAFFRAMLQDIEEPTLPFGLAVTQVGASDVDEARLVVDDALSLRLRTQARQRGVSAASLMHLAWAQVLAGVSGQDSVVFGTVLLGRMQGGEVAERGMGVFINTLPLRVELGEQTVNSAVAATHARLTQLLSHEHASLALAQRCSGLPGNTPLFSVLFNYRHSAPSAMADDTTMAWHGMQLLDAVERTHYPLNLNVDDLGEGFVLTAMSVAGIDAQRICNYMDTALQSLVTALEQTPQLPLNRLPILTVEEREHLLFDLNATDVDYPLQQTIHGLFEDQVSCTPQALAVLAGDERLTYRELNERSNQLAHHLREQGVGPDSRVAICVERGLDMVVGLLAILKAGGAYVPLDPTYPLDRLAYMLADSAPAAVLVQGSTRGLLGEVAVPVIDLDQPVWRDQPLGNPHIPELTPQHLVYVIYTSGSTGQPKGVMNEHHAVINRLLWMQDAYNLTSNDAVLQKTPFSFDVSVWEFFWPLMIGARLVMARPEGHKDPAYLSEVIKAEHITTLHFVPSMLDVFLAHGDVAACAGLKNVMCSGEALPGSLVRRFKSQLPGSALHNLYGPTEAAVDVTAWHCAGPGEQAPDNTPIGKPIANTRLYLLDGQMQPVPMGVIGELYIGGVQVARGYLHRPELTAERFLKDPFSDDPTARMYRTGDVARYRTDGNIEYLGRNDDQVKIRGLRIELGEIQARLTQYQGVQEAVVLAREDVPGDKRLIAYCTGQAHSTEALRSHLLQHLPEYMVPAVFVHLDALPLSPNGKLDRKALPAPGLDSLSRREYEAPVGDSEITLARLWAELLKVERVGRHDNFFELGGHSLLAVSLIARMRGAGMAADVRSLLARPTLSAQAAALGGAGGEIEVPQNRIAPTSTQITPGMLPLATLTQQDIDSIVANVPGGVANVQDIYGLAPLQAGILYHHLAADRGDPYLMQAQFAFTGPDRLRAFAQALQSVIERHDVLRTSVHWQGLSEPVQVVWRQASLVSETVELDSDMDALSQLQSRFDASRYRLDITRAPLLRLVHAWDAVNHRVVALLLFHHLAMDHLALEVLQQDMQACLLGHRERLGEPVPYRNYVAQTRLGISEQEHEAFFRQMLQDVEELTLPFGLAAAQVDARDVDEARLAVDDALSLRLRTQARQRGVSAASLMHLAWAQVLAGVSGQDSVVFGTVLLGRMQGGEGAERGMGVFINTLPLRIELGEQTVNSAVAATHARLTQLLSHEHASLALAQRCSGLPGNTPLFSVLFNYRHSAPSAMADDTTTAWQGMQLLNAVERTNYLLTVSVDDLGEGFAFTALAASGIDALAVCGYLHTALEHLLQALEHTPEKTLNRLPILSGAEQAHLLNTFNDTTIDYPQGLTLHQRVEARAAAHPDTVAALQQGQSLTYAELNRGANQLARHLRELGVQPDDRVAIVARRGLHTLTGLLAILKAGACYVPIDPTHPAERLNYLLGDCTPVAVLTQQALLETLPAVGVPLINLDLPTWLAQADTDLQVPGLSASNLAYVIYTSGSTGLPKGVMVEHQTLSNLVDWHCEDFDLRHGRHTSSVAGFGFDAMAWEVWPALCAGATLHLPPADVGNEKIDELLDWWCAQPLDVSFLPTPVAEYAFSQNLGHPTLRTLLIGGDRLRQFSRAQTFEVINNYGPTEATVVATSGRVEIGQPLHIGQPIANARVYLLDEQQRPVPIGVAGELYVGGAGVARGYLNRPEMTAERFLEDPFNPQARMYRTGDFARWLADGTIEYLGRNDDQVKIRGMRIELAEIDTALANFSGVKEAVVQVRDGRLVAWFTEHAALDIADLRQHLQARLPEYMVPSAYVRLHSLPLTANGKLDHKALPAPDQAALLSREYEAPQGEIETALVQIWAEVLQVGRVGRRDHFFELGGHSLLAMRMVSRVRMQLGVELVLSDLFANPQLAAVAQVLAQAGRSTLPPIVALSRDEDLPLSFAQQRLWFLAQMGDANSAYNIPAALTLRGALNVEALQRALARIVERHETLRSRFVQLNAEPQVLVVADLTFGLVVEDLRHEYEAQAVLQSRIDHEAAQPFDLENGPLIRGRLLVMANDEHVLLLTMHHIVSDGWSMGVLTQELMALYQAFNQGQPDPLPALSVQYGDFALWQRRWLSGDVLQRRTEYWQQALAGAPALLMVPTDRPRPAQQDYSGHSIEVQLDPALTAGLKALSQRHGTTLYMTLMAAWALLLGRLAGEQDVVIGSPAANRQRTEVEGLIGLFVNTLAVRIDTSGELSVEALLARVKAQTLAAQAHQDLPFEQVVEITRPVRSLSYSPLFQASLAWQNLQAPALVLEGIQVQGLAQASHFAKFDLALSLGEGPDGIDGVLDYATALFDESTVRRFIGYFTRLLQAMVANDQAVLAQVDLLDDAEREHLLCDFNDTDADYPREHTVHGVFEAQVQRTPDALALGEGEQRLTYRELNDRANRLAHHLIGLGVKPGDNVAILLERSVALVVSQLAISKCAAAYVPLDIHAPTERQRFMVEDSAAVVLLTDDSRVIDYPARRVDLDKLPRERRALHNPDLAQSSETVAYIMYTSGSTGTPKGVRVPHRAITRLVINNGYADFNPQDRVAFASNPAFDASTMDVWGALLNGAQVLVIDHDTLLEPAHFGQALSDSGATILFVTTALFNQYVQLIPDALKGLRILLCGGERADPAVFRRLLALAPDLRLVHCYGPTETTTYATTHEVKSLPADADSVPIGGPISNTRIYVLDERQQPVPSGVTGEICIGGEGVAKGYLNRPELTAEKFVADPFSERPEALMYRTGDLGRWSAQGLLECIGRNDDQVKIRGFRIELGEIEMRLATCPGVNEVVVLAREDVPGDKRLVAYYTAHDQALDIAQLRAHLQGQLPDYMVPSAYVQLASLPLTGNGKVDRKALPEPDQASLLSREYAAPQGEIEVALAQIWVDVLKVEHVGRHDHFFELGGHSLLAVSVIERMRQGGMNVDVRILFSQPTLMALAAAVGSGREIEVPANRIPANCQRITPDLLSLVELDQDAIDRVVASVPGGAANVQDIYPLAPLQEGILYHHITAGQGDTYLLQSRMAFTSLERMNAFSQALQQVIDRHDILRTSVVWEGLQQPLQVVWRHAELTVQSAPVDPAAGDVLTQLHSRFDARHYRLELNQAPLIRLVYAHDPAQQRIVAVVLFHHIALDHVALDVVRAEMQASLLGQHALLGEAIPYRNYVAQARLGVSEQEHEAFFRDMLADIDEPTLPFGLQSVQGDGSDIEEVRQVLPDALSLRLRGRARELGVSAASLFHLAWAQVLAAASGRESVVFGTVLMGRMQGGDGADRALGVFINTLPLRVDTGSTGVRAGVRATHARLTALLAHEHASLSLAQRCSGVAAPLPLFSAMLNYRHSAAEADLPSAWQGIETLGGEERTNFPLTLSVDDLGEGFMIRTVTLARVGAQRICEFVHTALQVLVEVLEQTPQMPLNRLSILPAQERNYLLTGLNATAVDYPLEQTIQSVFEAQVERTPDAVALVAGEQQLTYRELNERANQLAHHLRQQGVGPDARVVLCVERGLELVIGLWAILKAGGAYVPVDPGYPPERIAYMLQDCGAVAVLVHGATRGLLKDVAVPMIDFDQNSWQTNPLGNPQVPELNASHMAYVIYTSGSTGTPKGVMVEHRGLNNLVFWSSQLCPNAQRGALLQKAPFSFDGSVWEFFWPLTTGMRLVLARPDGHREPEYLHQLVREQQVTVIKFVPAMLAQFLDVAEVSQCSSLTDIVCGGGELTAELGRRVQQLLPKVRLHNVYGPTEATVDSSSWTLEPGAPVPDVQLPIGKPISNTRLYVLDANDLPVPFGVSGHLHIGGVGVARGYLGLPTLMAERFIASPFVAGDRLYRTGDLVRYLPDGSLQFLGRNDFQVKLRGLRVELGEIEARLSAYPALKDVAVLMRDERLVAYFTLQTASQVPAIEDLRAYLLRLLPDYMVPSAYVSLDTLPLSPNGKLDRRALPAPGLDAVLSRDYEAPRGPVETALAAIWTEVLKIERVGRHDHFFELGGHSLLAVNLVSRMRQAGLNADARTLFSEPTLAALAAKTVGHVEQVAVPETTIPSLQRKRRL